MAKENAAKVSRTVLVAGPFPPPIHGLSIAIQRLISSDTPDTFTLHHVDTSRSTIEPTGRPALSKLIADLKILASIVVKMVTRSVDVLYFPLSQVSLGSLRDAFLIATARIFNVKTIGHLHGGGYRHMYERTVTLQKWLLRRSLRHLSTVIILDESLKWHFSGLVSDEKIEVVPNGIPRSKISENQVDEALHDRKTRNSLQLVFLSNLIESKGVREVVEAVAKLNGTSIPCQARFAGQWQDPEFRREIETFVSSEDLDNQCQFLGVVEDEQKWELLLSSDIFILPTRYPLEGQPISIIEAMAAGLPIISSNRGAIPEMIDDGQIGYLIPAGDEDVLYQTLRQLARDRTKIATMGRHARNKFLASYTADSYVSGVFSVFENVLDRPVSGGRSD